MIAASAVGGGYSMIILVDLPPALSAVLKIAVGLLIVGLAFRFYRLKSFFIAAGIFVFSSFVFLGVTVGIYMLFKTEAIAVKNSTVYFDIGARGLLLCAFFAYAVSSLIVRLYNRSLAKGEMYMLKIENGGKSVSALALADTGNKLREPFSGKSVIVVKSDLVKDIFDRKSLRLIPAATVNSVSYLEAFKPDRVVVKNSNGEEVIDGAYVALSDEIKNGSCSAVINPEILSL